MRQGQQKRMRGRSRGGKGPNPLSRSYESNGPDVKVRGTAAHIAEKYVQLARDAQSSGDPILAEAYLQHAEHYFRIIAAAQPQFGQQGYGQAAEEEDDGEDSEFEGPIPSMPQSYTPPNQSYDDQPRLVQPARERNYGDRQNYGERQEARPEGEQPFREQPYREQPYREPRFRDRNERFSGERPQREERFSRDGRDDRPQREDRPYRAERSFEPAPGAAPGPEGEGGGEPRPYAPRQSRRDRRFGDRSERPFRERNGEGQPFAERHEERPPAERPQAERQPAERAPHVERSFQPAPVVPVDQPQPDIHDDNALSTLPSFITGAPAAAAAPPAVEGEGEARAPLRPRRRRVTKRVEPGETLLPNIEPAGE
ncbi:DUF4167 domain-containing protein [Labrys monachus]|uniref:DUF4167 domain-containing protein n=1 Tax=Labrys monachus TaxID=217067 RepID=A0ABU0FP97_9HYPH|nr:DUF4167 domain-containing protein [Labrys monachus]MDQ0396286.1 hypothetical protein [Labrys monachus]